MNEITGAFRLGAVTAAVVVAASTAIAVAAIVIGG